MTAGLRIGLLGPVDVHRGEFPVPISAAKQRVVLALLALRYGEVVSVDALVDGLWPGGPPTTALKTVQGYVSALRRTLDPGGGAAGSVIVTRPPGYALDVAAEAIDLQRFEQLWKEGREAVRGDEAEHASPLLGEALSLWRGEPLVDIVMEGRISLEASLLDEMRLSCTEDYADAQLACGEQESVVSLLDPLAVANPFRERLAGQLMLALYRCGRQADALSTYRSLSARLSEELAVSPSPALVALERSILNHDPALLHASKAHDTAGARGAPSVLVSRADRSERSSNELPTNTVTSVRRSERKVVSVLFCDLVGYTATAYSQDPEDISRMLTTYHDQVRAEVERHGGVVEKFIGDAAVGLWGAPRAYEDDAERAVRAALALVDAISLDVRVAVNTGEVLVSVADSGEVSVVGDVINTAARLQTVAPTGGIVVGQGTLRATRAAITYDELGPVELKGIPEPMPLWRVVDARSIAEGRDTDTRTPFVGRAHELDLLRGVFERALVEECVQLVTVSGEPGIGKSRLVAELEAWLSARPTPTAVRRGRCIAYGDGIGLWPLAEIVKAHAGISETDSEDEARTRLEAAVAGMDEAGWLRARLAPLVGLPGEGGEREEVFAAWQRFFDEVAVRAPLVLIFEDLHWADPAILAFIQYLAEWSTGVAILIVCTARPELLEEHPDWAGGLANATTLGLRALATDDTEHLARSLLRDLPISADVRHRLVERCGGNPLYAEEYARLLRERTRLVISEVEMPDTVVALIAARLDTLDLERKGLLRDAAVVGKVFWAGAVASIGNRDPASVRNELHELARKELIRRSRVSTVPGDVEYAFWHDLVHDVTYRQIPRAERAEKHHRAAEWIERISGDRVADRADVLAYHYAEAVALRRAIGQEENDSLRRAAVRFGGIAAEHAIGLDLERATRLVDKAIDLAEGKGDQMPKLLCVRGSCLVQAGDLAEASHVLEWARSEAESAGDTEVLADTMFQQIEAAYFRGDGAECMRVAGRVLARFDREAPTSKIARVIGNAAFIFLIRGDHAGSLELVDRQLAVAEKIGDRVAAATGMNARGLARSELGDRVRGFDDLERSLEMFKEYDPPYVTMGLMHLAGQRLAWDGPEAAAETYREGIAHAARTHNSTYEMLTRAFLVWRLLAAGAWDDALAESEAVLAWAGDSALQHASLVTPPRAYILALRGDAPAAGATLAGALDRARKIVDPQIVSPTLTVAALLALIDGDPHKARTFATECSGLAVPSETVLITETARVLVATGAADQARPLADDFSEPTRASISRIAVRAMLAESNGDTEEADHLHAESAQRWRLFGHRLELAHALAGRARCLRTIGNAAQAEPLATEATSLFRGLGVDEHVLSATGWPSDSVAAP